MAKSCLRHFKALARKNIINWQRTPVCSVLEVLFPMALMIGLAVIRYEVPPGVAVTA